MEKASTADMVKDAIKTLGERGGSSLHNIKKYIEAVYQVDMRYRAPRIRKFLRGAVSDGGLVQTTGRGASGSFKLPPVKPKQQAAAAQAAPAPAAPARPRPRAAPAASSRASRASSTASTATSAPSSPRSSPSASSVASSVASAASSRIARDERAKARDSKR